MNHLDTIKKAVEWARKNPQAYAEFVERRRKEREEDAAIEAEARAEEAKERQTAKEAEEKAAKGPVISISGEGGGNGQATQKTPAAHTPPMPPPEGENKPVEGAQGEGKVNDAPQTPDAPEGKESANGEVEAEKGEATKDGDGDSAWTFTGDDGETYKIEAEEVEEGDGPVADFPE